MSTAGQQTDETLKDLAHRLEKACETRVPIPPPSEGGLIRTTEDAYAVQTAWSERRLGQGDRIVGRKVGLTSKAMQDQLGVDEPDYGGLWASRQFVARDGRVDIPTDLFVQPRLEGEIAFLLEKPLTGPGVTADGVLDATAAFCGAVEIIDSRIEDWRITLVDTVADNASYGGFVVGDWNRGSDKPDLSAVEMYLHQNGKLAAQGTGAAVLGHPASSVAWLANKLASLSVRLEPGDIVLSGSLGKAVPINLGDEFLLEVSGCRSISVTFT